MLLSFVYSLVHIALVSNLRVSMATYILICSLQRVVTEKLCMVSLTDDVIGFVVNETCAVISLKEKTLPVIRKLKLNKILEHKR